MRSTPDDDTTASAIFGDGAPADEPVVAPTDVLARVKAEGLRRRNRRHRRNGVLAALGVLVLAVPAVALVGGDDGRPDELQVATEGDGDPSDGPSADRRAGDDAAATTMVAPTLAPSTTSVTFEGQGVPVEEGGSGGPATTSAPPATTPRTVDPATTMPPTTAPPTTVPPANQPLVASWASAPATAVVGQPVTFVVSWSDPDAQLTYDMFSANGTVLAPPCTVTRGEEPATPAGGSGQLTYTHTFTEPGTYSVAVALGTGDCRAPYADSTSIEASVVVAAAA